ncbi:MAG TPA: cyanophycin synthetase [Solirubrobacterales bacterium]|nr:cyanophycin synthetase [Solirubrobacterales bacterium]
MGLERIRRLVSLLGMPQHRFASIHVVGTNGKSSVAEMTGALLRAHGKAVGVYLSPHTERWSERVRIGGAEIAPGEFAAAAERVAQSIETVNRTLAEDESVTQFEAVTAIAFVALASAGVEFGVIEAGLGGRLDATNVLPSGATVLTSVGLEHTEWLGDTQEAIAAEKLAVLRDHTTLVIGRLDEGARELAIRTAAERNARLIAAGELDPGVRLAVPGAYQRRNFAVATAVAGATLGALDHDRVQTVAEGLELPGRVQLLEGDPPVILDAAHNPDGARALAEALPEAVGQAPVVACLASLADKDAAGVLAALAPRLAAAICTELPGERLARAGRPGAAATDAARLAELARDAGLTAVDAVPEPAAAVERARELARGQGGVALVTGSHYLLSYA